MNEYTLSFFAHVPVALEERVTWLWSREP